MPGGRTGKPRGEARPTNERTGGEGQLRIRGLASSDLGVAALSPHGVSVHCRLHVDRLQVCGADSVVLARGQRTLLGHDPVYL
jgi:hypothetical protein